MSSVPPGMGVADRGIDMLGGGGGRGIDMLGGGGGGGGKGRSDGLGPAGEEQQQQQQRTSRSTTPGVPDGEKDEKEAGGPGGGSSRCVMGANWMKQANEMMLLRMARFTEEDRKRLQEEILSCRRYMVQHRMVGRPVEEPKHIKAKLKRFRRAKFEGVVARRTAPDENFVKSNYWSYTRVPMRQPVLMHAHDHLDTLALRMFNSLLTFAMWDATERPDAERTLVVQLLIHKCLENEDLCNEFYMQLIKQTTDNTESGSIYIRYWQLFAVVCNIAAPSSEIIRNYLRSHLRRSTMDSSSEECRYATYCQKCITRTLEKPPRKCPPSYKEISALFNKKLVQETIHLLNGRTCIVEFHSHHTVEEVLRITTSKISFKAGSQGWALMESLGANERCMTKNDIFCDCLFRWEQYVRKNNLSTQVRVTLKKRIFIGAFCNESDEKEVAMLADQCVLDVFEGRLPLDHLTATHLCALRAASEDGDVEAVMRILPRQWRDRLSVESVAKLAASMTSEPARVLHLQFLETCRQWEFFGACLFEVAQKFSNSFPETVFLAINQKGIHFLKSRHANTALLSYPFEMIASFSTEARYILYIVIKLSMPEKLTVCTKAAHHAAFLIRDYMTELKLLPELPSPFTAAQRPPARPGPLLKRSQSEESALSLTAAHRLPNGPQTAAAPSEPSSRGAGDHLESSGRRSRPSGPALSVSPTSSSSTSPHPSAIGAPHYTHRSRSLPPNRSKEPSREVARLAGGSSESPTSSLADTATSDSADAPLPPPPPPPPPPPHAPPLAVVTGPSTSLLSQSAPVYAQINCACTFQDSLLAEGQASLEETEEETEEEELREAEESGAWRRRREPRRDSLKRLGEEDTAPLAGSSGVLPESGRTFRNETGRLETIL